VKIVHTSDWHVGRRWKQILRLEETAAVLAHLADFIEREAVDLVLHTGDVFDVPNPPAEAEQLVNEFFVRVGRAGARMVVLAGNHDDPKRFDARSLLTEYARVDLLGQPRSARKGGCRIIETRSGETAVVAALPFATPGKWVSALQLAGAEGEARSLYAEMFQLAAKDLTGPFRGDAVNLFMAHTHLEGAVFGESERRVHLGENWAATPQTLPTSASYIALGHIHKPQKLAGTLPAYYAGSPLQLDFGEAGQEKSFVVVTARAGKPAKVEHVPYQGGLPLEDLRATLPELERLAATHAAGRWLRVTVPLDEKDPDLNRKVRQLLPNALVVHSELPERKRPVELHLEDSASPQERYSAYHTQEYQAAPAPLLLEMFQQLHEQAAGEER
jgi:DNA repair protein SbcD/Mre11